MLRLQRYSSSDWMPNGSLFSLMSLLTRPPIFSAEFRSPYRITLLCIACNNLGRLKQFLMFTRPLNMTGAMQIFDFLKIYLLMLIQYLCLPHAPRNTSLDHRCLSFLENGSNHRISGIIHNFLCWCCRNKKADAFLKVPTTQIIRLALPLAR